MHGRAQAPAAPTDEAAVKVERRARVRYPCSLLTVCQRPHAALDDMWFPAAVRDLSTDGVGLVVDCPFAPDTLLEFALVSPELPTTVLARVEHASPVGDGRWLIGCAFIQKLTEVELDSLLGAVPA